MEEHQLHECPDCGGLVKPAEAAARVIQQAELIPHPVEIVEHRAGACQCVKCGKVHYAPLPLPVEKGGLIGPELTALAAYGQRVLEGLRKLFHIIHRREEMAAASFQQALTEARDELIATGLLAPPGREAQNMAARFRLHGESYFRFITVPGIEPTNNLAEQAIRFVVLDRMVTQGTRGERGRRWSERIWTAIATCAQQGRSVFSYLRDAIHAHFSGKPTPSLLPAGP